MDGCACHTSRALVWEVMPYNYQHRRCWKCHMRPTNDLDVNDAGVQNEGTFGDFFIVGCFRAVFIPLLRLLWSRDGRRGKGS